MFVAVCIIFSASSSPSRFRLFVCLVAINRRDKWTSEVCLFDDQRKLHQHIAQVVLGNQGRVIEDESRCSQMPHTSAAAVHVHTAAAVQEGYCCRSSCCYATMYGCISYHRL